MFLRDHIKRNSFDSTKKINVLFLAVLLIFLSLRVSSLLPRNIDSIRFMKSSSPVAEIKSISTNQDDHIFRLILSSHLFAISNSYQESAVVCKTALLSENIDENLAKYINSLCTARIAAFEQEWSIAVNALVEAKMKVPGQAFMISRETDVALANYYLSKWQKTLSNIDLCTATHYFDMLADKEESPNQLLKNIDKCDKNAALVKGPIKYMESIGCIALNPQTLDFPNTFSVFIVKEKCESIKNISQHSSTQLSNKAFNSGFSLPELGEPALGIYRYYENDIPYETQSLLAYDAFSEKTYLSIAPKRERRPDSLVAGRFSVRDSSQYLLGGIARGNITLGCIWWGGASHGKTDAISITEDTWSLSATILQPPQGAEWCSLIFYNNNLRDLSSIDSLFFSPITPEIEENFKGGQS